MKTRELSWLAARLACGLLIASSLIAVQMAYAEPARTVATPLPPGDMGTWGVMEVLSSNLNLMSLEDTITALNAAKPNNTLTYQTPVINMFDGFADGHFGNSLLFHSTSVGSTGTVDNLALAASGKVQVTDPGNYTFCVNSDDGFELSIDGGIVAQATSPQGATDRFGQVSLASGTHDIRLLYWEGGGYSTVEVFAAKGLYSNFTQTTDWRLVGDAAGPLHMVPEPSSMLLGSVAGLFFAGLVFARRRKK